MSSTRTRSPRSVRAWMVVQTLLASAVTGIVSFCVIFAVTRQFLNQEVRDDLDRMSSDLSEEYRKYRSTPEKFFDCIREDVEERGAEQICIVLLDAAGKVAFATHSDPAILSRMLKESQRDPGDHVFGKTERDGRQKRHFIRIRTLSLPEGTSLLLGYDVTADHDHLVFLAVASLIALLLHFLLAGVGAWVLGTRFTRSLADIAVAAKRIEGGEVARRVEASRTHGREIVDLVQAFNAMCDANERTMAELRTLSDNIAHDLRTPLTRMRGNAELAATGALPPEELPAAIAEETSAMIEMINTMLEISQTGCRIERTPRAAVDLAETVRRVSELYQPIAEDKSQTLGLELAPDLPSFMGHAGKIQQLVGNLLDNAIKFTPAGGHVAVSLVREDGRAVLRVADDGPGIAPDDLPHVFTRFWRSDGSRSLPGNGLGLALVKAIVTSYSGTVEAENLDPHGTRFTVALPLT